MKWPWKFFTFCLLVLNLFWGYAFYLIYRVGVDQKGIEDLLPDEIQEKYQDYESLNGVVDAISYAQQLGRLDIISLILGFFGIIIGAVAVGWLGFVRHEAKENARDEARREMRKPWVKKLITKKVDVELRGFKQEAEKMKAEHDGAMSYLRDSSGEKVQKETPTVPGDSVELEVSDDL